MKPISTQASMSAIWGALFAVVLVVGADFIHPGINAAVAKTTMEAASASVSSQVAAVGSVFGERTVYRVHANTEKAQNLHHKKAEAKKLHIHKRTYAYPPSRSFEAFYNDDISKAFRVIERNREGRGP